MSFYAKDGTYIDDPNISQAQADQMYAYSQAHRNDPPAGVTADDLRYLTPPDAPLATDQTGQYRMSYAGNKVYLPNGPRPQNTFAHTYSWDPLTGTWKASLNGGGLGGAITGTAALAGPALIGPALSGAFGGAATAPGEISATTAPYDPGFLPTASGAAGSLPSASLAGIPGMTGAAPSVAGAANTAGAGAGLGSAAGTGGSILNRLTSGSNLGSLAGLIPLLAAAAHGGGSAPGGFAYPQLGDLLNSEVSRVQSADSLAPMVSKLAASRMPITAR